MSAPLRLLLIAAAMTAVLAGLVGHHAWRRASGEEIRLAMEPVDPRDVLLGHYVELRTPLHTLDTRRLGAPETGWRRGQTVYVAVETDDAGGSVPVSVHQSRPADRLAVQGRILGVSEVYDFEDAPDPVTGDLRETARGEPFERLFVRYNLERYYAPRNDALALEAMRNEDRLRLIVSVGSDGAAVIKGLEIDGETRYDRLY